MWHNRVDIDTTAVKEVVGTNVTALENYAFHHCTGLTSITFMSGAAPTLGIGVFGGVPGGVSVAYPEGADESYADIVRMLNPGYSFSTGTLTITTNAGSENWRSGASISKAAVTTLIVSEGVSAIAEYAFSGCENLSVMIFESQVPR